MAYNPLHKLNDNLRALRITLGGHVPAADETVALKAYSGFGGIKAVLYGEGTKEAWLASGATAANMRLYEGLQEFHAMLKEHFTAEELSAVLASLKQSVLTAFYKPPVVVQSLYKVLQQHNIIPQHLYEPSAGAGVFLTEALKTFPSLQKITAVEKDLLTGKVLQALARTVSVNINVQIRGFEETPDIENGTADLVASNIPFGNFSVHDPAYPAEALSGKIHNYFFAKGLDKLRDGGLLAYVTTDAFLNSPSNYEARKHLFTRADFVSVATMPDNLMKDTGGTEAPSHLLLVQKNSQKKDLSEEEKCLLQTVTCQNEFGAYPLNEFFHSHPGRYCGNTVVAGKNQYGRVHQTVWQNGGMNDIGGPLEDVLQRDIEIRFSPEAFRRGQQQFHAIQPTQHEKKLTFLPPPQDNGGAEGAQLGLFDALGTVAVNRAFAYLTKDDERAIQRHSTRVAAVTRTEEKEGHESIVLLTARARNSAFYVYKLYSNLKEVAVTGHWVNANTLQHSLAQIGETLKGYSYTFRYEGEAFFEAAFGLNGRQYVKDCPAFYKEGTLAIHNGKIGTLHDIQSKQGALLKPFSANGKGESFYKKYIALRDTYFTLSLKESEANVAQADLRQSLNERYQAFTGQYGLLNQPANRNALLSDALAFIALSSLERKEGEEWVKADIFSTPLFNKEETFSTDDPVEALARCLNETGRVDISFIARTIGRSGEETIASLGNHIYLNPFNHKWETADCYLSGNVVHKLAQAKEALALQPDDWQMKRSLDAIASLQPEKVPFEVLDFNMGERWLPLNYYQRFATHLFQTDTDVKYFSSLDHFKVIPAQVNARLNSEFAVTTKSGSTTYGQTLMEHALENTAPFFTYEVEGVNGSKVRVPDNEATQLAHQKIEAIRSAFGEWLRELPAGEKKDIESLYNDTFNCYVLREYNGDHLSFLGLDKAALGITDLYSSQKNSVWRILQNRGALIDHEVGLGKTLTIVAAAHEMKRLGIVHKPLVIALKANVSQVAETYRKAYPAARILAPGEHDFTPQKRQQLFHAIKNNHWDCIILTHDQFGRLPQSPAIQQLILRAELENVEKDLQTLKDLGGNVSKKMLKGLEIRKNNLSNALKEVVQRLEQKKDSDISFQELGVDHLFVDEAHKFKNLGFTTRHNRVAGLGNTEGSQKALNLLFAVRTLQQQFKSDLCVTFLSGTPISNSLTEMYLLFKYLRPREMERQRIENFDGWAAVFARKTTDFEFSVTNEIIAKERFRHFIKVPELALFYNEITDYKTAKHIRLDKPTLKEELVNIKPTADQRVFTKALMQFARTGDGELLGRLPLTPDEDKGRMLIATNYAKKMAVDMRLIDGVKYDDDPGNKISVCARKVAGIYHESSEHRGTQIIFSDIGTPKPDEFNVYDALKEKLVREYAIPPHQITFIHDWTDTKKPELFRKMNEGSIRILLGSTDKAGTGLNVQRRVVAMHHLDIPWKPSEFEQRNGRGARQGNVIAKRHYGNEVKNFIYAVEQSLDNYKFNLLKNKQTFITQMKNAELSVRTIDEGAIDEKNGMNFSEYIAVLSGDTTLLEKSKVEKKVAVLESLRTVHGKEVAKAKYRLERLQDNHNHTKGILDSLSKDEAFYRSVLRFEKDGSKANPIQITGLQSSDPDTIGTHLLQLYHQWQPAADGPADEKIGTLYGFDLYIRRQQESREEAGLFTYGSHNSFYAQHPEGVIKYTVNNGCPTLENPKLAARYFLNAIDRAEILKGQYAKEVQKLEADVPVLKNLIAKPFEKEGELKALKAELSGLEHKLVAKLKEAQMTVVQEPEAPYGKSARAPLKEPLLKPKPAPKMRRKCIRL